MMSQERDMSLKLAQFGFRIAGIGPLRKFVRPVESDYMFKYYEKMLLQKLGDAKDQEKYNSFTETFAGNANFGGFSARYNRKIELTTTEEGKRILVWNTINENPLVATTGLSFVKITFDTNCVSNVEFYGEKIPKGKLHGSVVPVYNEVPELNKWYFLEMLNRDLEQFDINKN